MSLNEKISAWFEPFESLPPIVLPKRPPGMGVDPRPSHRPGELSPKEAWKVGPGMKWYARKWDTDEAANARLLEAMPNPDLSRGYGDMKSSDASLDWRCDPFGDGELKYAQYHKDRKTAVVLAFCKFAGIEVGE